MYVLVVYLVTREQIGERLEEDDAFQDERDPSERDGSKYWYGRIGPLGFRLTECKRVRQPMVGVVMVVGTPIRFVVKTRDREEALLQMARWVNSLDPDRIQNLTDFMRYGLTGPLKESPLGSAWTSRATKTSPRELPAVEAPEG